MRGRLSPFNVSWLLLLVLIVGCELAALRSASPLATGWSLKITVVVLLLASFAAKFSRENARAWWFGFALIGWIQFLIGMIIQNIYPVDDAMLPTHWLTMKLVNWSIPAAFPADHFYPALNRRFDSLADFLSNPYGALLCGLYLRANAVVSIFAGTAGGITSHLICMPRIKSIDTNSPSF